LVLNSSFYAKIERITKKLSNNFQLANKQLMTLSMARQKGILHLGQLLERPVEGNKLFRFEYIC